MENETTLPEHWARGCSNAKRWAKVPGFPDYQVNSDGEVYSMKRGGWRKLKTNPDSHGYPSLNLYREGNGYRFGVHLLVARAFIGGKKKDQEIRHLDGDRTNAKLSNLTYGTKLENQKDKVKHGNSLQGTKHPSAKLKEEDIPRIRDDDRSSSVIADEFGVSSKLIRSIKKRERWAHV